MVDSLDTSNLKPKSFWSKPEGTTGMIFALGLVAGGVWLLFNALPLIISMLQDTLHAVFLAAILGAILYVVFDKRFRAIAWYGYQGIMRALTGLFVTVDPIGIVENYIRSLQQNLAKMDTQIGNLKGQMANLKRTIATNSGQADNALKLAEQAKKTGNNNALALQSRSAARLQDSNNNLQALYTKLEVLYRVLSKMRDNADTIIEDTQDEVATRKREYAAISAGTNAMRSAMSIISGDPDKKAIFDQSMEHLADSISMQVGEMDNFMRMSEKITSTIDLQNGVFADEGEKMLSDWEKKADSVLLTPADKKQILAAAKDPDDQVDLVSVGSSKADNPYKGMLKKSSK